MSPGSSRIGAVGPELGGSLSGLAARPRADAGVGLPRHAPKTLGDRSVLSTISPLFITATRSAISADDAQIVGDEQRSPCRARVPAASLDQLRAGSAPGSVTSSAVVGSSAIRSSGSLRERHRDHHALALPAGELVRIGAEPAPGSGMPTLFEQFDDARARRARGQALMDARGISPICRRSV
jgi:hypothetical protein